jgi:hypothetical protein
MHIVTTVVGSRGGVASADGWMVGRRRAKEDLQLARDGGWGRESGLDMDFGAPKSGRYFPGRLDVKARAMMRL